MTLARERAGFSKEQTAQLCRVSRRTITDWEGGRVVSPPVDRIATALNVDEAFLHGPEVEEVPIESVSFRALTSLSTRRARSAVASSRLTTLLTDWLDERYSTPLVAIPSVMESIDATSSTEPSAQRAAEFLRAAWSMPHRPVSSMIAILERHGARVLSLAKGEREVDAFSYWSNGRPYIFVNQDKSAERVRFDLAHELGHLVLHKGICTVRDRHFEFEANEFASAFLMPTDAFTVQAYSAGTQLRMSDVFVLKRSWRVSATATVRRLHDLELINDWQYRTWMVELSSLGYRRGEPDGIRPEISELLTACLRLAREDGWTLQRIAADIGVHVQELREGLTGLTVLSIAGGAPKNCPRPLAPALVAVDSFKD